MQMALCFGLNRLRHRVQHIAGFVEPATLFFRRAKDLAQRIPEPQSTIANGKIRRMGKTAPLQIKQQLSPTLGAFAVAVRKADDLLAAPFIRADQHQNALFFLSHSRAEVDTVRPDVDEPARAEIAALPAVILVPPIGFKPRNCGR